MPITYLAFSPTRPFSIHPISDPLLPEPAQPVEQRRRERGRPLHPDLRREEDDRAEVGLGVPEDHVLPAGQGGRQLHRHGALPVKSVHRVVVE